MSNIAKILKSIVTINSPLFSVVSEEFIVSYFTTISNFLIRIKYEYQYLLKNRHLEDKSHHIDQKLKNLKQWEKTILLSIKFLQQLSRRLTQTNPIIEYETDVGVFKIEKITASSLSGAAYVLNSQLNYSIIFDNNCFTATSVTDLNSDVIVASIVWKIAPLKEISYLSTDKDFAMISWSIMDEFHHPIAEISHKVKLEITSDSSPKHICQNFVMNSSDLSFSSSKCGLSNTANPMSSLEGCNNCLPTEVEIPSFVPSTFLVSANKIGIEVQVRKISLIKGRTVRHPETQIYNFSEFNASFYVLSILLITFCAGLVIIRICEKSNKMKIYDENS